MLGHPGIEPGPHLWQRRILTTDLMTLFLHIIIYYNSLLRREFESRSLSSNNHIRFLIIKYIYLYNACDIYIYDNNNNE